MLSDGDGKAHAKVKGHPYLVSKEDCINHVHKKSSKELHLIKVLEVQSCNILLTNFLYYFYYLLIYITLYIIIYSPYMLYYNIIYLISDNNFIY